MWPRRMRYELCGLFFYKPRPSTTISRLLKCCMNNPVEVYNAADEVQASLIVGMLQQNGIRAQVIGGILNAALGELPASSVSPRVWVNDSDETAARQLIETWQLQRTSEQPVTQLPGWTCPRCGTDIELGFDVCWKCLYNPAAC